MGETKLNFQYFWSNYFLEWIWNVLSWMYWCWSLITLDDSRDKLLSKRNVKHAVQLDASDPFSPYRRCGFTDGFVSEYKPGMNTAADIPAYAARNYGDDPGFATRELLGVEEELQPSGKIFKKYILGEYHWTSYNESLKYMHNVGDGLYSIGLRPHDSLIIFCETRYEWMVCLMACFMNSIKVITLYSTLGKEALANAIRQSDCSVLITSSSLLGTVKDAIGEDTALRFVIQVDNRKVIDHIPNVQVLLLSTLRESGRNTSVTASGANLPSREDIAVIMYTSGSSGTPKAVLLSHGNLVSMISAIGTCLPELDFRKFTIISYLPLAHILEMVVEMYCYGEGVRIGYSSPHTITGRSTGIKKGQMGDMHALRPNAMIAVPMMLDRMYYTILDRAARYGVVRKNIFFAILAYKQAMYNRGWTTPVIDRLLLRRLNKLVFGGKMEKILVGGAPLSAEVQNFIRCAMCVSIFQGYGLTETCASGAIADEDDVTDGTVGAPVPSIEIRLRNWEQGGYKNTDKPEPRGEVLIGGNSVAKGYIHASPEEMENFITINDVPYFCTGDIGKITANGGLVIIDRKKDLVKSKHGEYISLAKVESVAKLFPVTEHCCACVHSSGNVALLIVPNEKQLRSFVKSHQLPNHETLAELCSDKVINDAVMKTLKEEHMKGRLQTFEMPARVCLLAEEWAPGSEFLTNSMKARRKNIQEAYKRKIDELFKQ